MPLAQTNHVSDYGRWTLFRRQPSVCLAPYVREIQGYVEEGGPNILRKEVPSGDVPLILVFGPGFSLHDVSQPGRWRPLDRSFVAGLHERHALVGSHGKALCMQVDFTPWGARRFLGAEMSELANSIVDLNAIVGGLADRLEERLADARDWDQRFAIVEQLLSQRIVQMPAEDPRVRAAWDAIDSSGGHIRVGALARQLDCSRKHLISVFRREVGLPPKTLARIIRFERAVHGLQAGRRSSLAELAVACGYADQAHFNRDFLELLASHPVHFAKERFLMAPAS